MFPMCACDAVEIRNARILYLQNVRPNMRQDVEEELARAARTSKAAMASVHASLDTEKSRCQDLRLRLERQAREHHLLLTDANQRFLHSRQELDKASMRCGLKKAQNSLRTYPSAWGGVFAFP